MGKRICAIDDDRIILDALETILEDMGHEVYAYNNSLEGEKAAIYNEFDLILIDLRMPQKNGAEVTRNIIESRPAARILVITGHPSDPLGQKALDYGAVGLIKKPFEMGKILDILSGKSQ